MGTTGSSRFTNASIHRYQALGTERSESNSSYDQGLELWRQASDPIRLNVVSGSAVLEESGRAQPPGLYLCSVNNPAFQAILAVIGMVGGMSAKQRLSLESQDRIGSVV